MRRKTLVIEISPDGQVSAVLQEWDGDQAGDKTREIRVPASYAQAPLEQAIHDFLTEDE